MPFDTTYHIFTTVKDRQVSYIAPGGKDIHIYLNEGEMPPGLDSLPGIRNDIDNAIQVSVPGNTNEEYSNSGYVPVFFIFFLIAIVIIRIKFYTSPDNSEDNSYTAAAQPESTASYLTYYGEELNFTDEEIAAALQKRIPYFKALTQPLQQKFLNRTQLFIADKIFKIHDTIGYKEMPILISAAAVQLTMGLEKYLLPNFKFIHVYPEEFLGTYPTIRVLEGNVNGHTINLSWKHFLKGYEDGSDGQNVGLHELSHALYYQNFIVEENVDRNFRDTFDEFNNYGNKVFQQEALPGNDLYSDYALKNFQEFWAESMEIFFEKPAQLKMTYPKLYESLVEILNQDPLQLPIT